MSYFVPLLLAKFEEMRELIDRIQSEALLIDDLLVKVGFDYSNKIHGRVISSEHDFYKFRNSLSFRLRSVIFHTINLLNYEDEIPNMLLQIDTDRSGAGVTFGQGIVVDAIYLFESVLFNLASLLDYFGSFICMTLGKHYQKWSGLEKSCKNGENNLLRDYEIGPIVRHFHNEFVSKLMELRAHVIHDSAYAPPRTVKYDFISAKYEVKLLVPNKAKKMFSKYRNNAEEIQLSMFTIWLVEEVINGLIQILHKLREDLETHRKIPLVNEVFTFRS